ncbi:MAG TPA: class D sortase [Terriglobales bacterium]
MFAVGVFLLSVFFAAWMHSLVFSHFAIWQFKSVQAAQRNTSPEAQDVRVAGVDVSLWGTARIHAYERSLASKIAPPIALLSIPRLRLTAPVFDGTDELTLNRGVGRIESTATAGSDGNVGIAGHRDGFFRGLKDIKQGDIIKLETTTQEDTYVVGATDVVAPTDVSVLAGSSTPAVTLITCYPFYFVGNAPHRFVVKAWLQNRTALPVSSTEHAEASRPQIDKENTR